MLRKKETKNFYGVELTDEQKESYIAWLNHPEGELHMAILNGMTRVAELNAMKDPTPGADVELFRMEREQYLGELKGLRKVKNLAVALEEL